MSSPEPTVSNEQAHQREVKNKDDDQKQDVDMKEKNSLALTKSIRVIQDELGNFYTPFNPQDHGLPDGFSLMNYSDGRDVLMDRIILHQDLQTLLSTFFEGQNVYRDNPPTILSEGVTATPLQNSDWILLESTHILPPMLDEPYNYGYIAFLVTMNYLYAEGVTWCSTHRMLLRLSQRLRLSERNIVVPLIAQGYSDAATANNVTVQTVRVIEDGLMGIGGVITSLIQRQMYLKYQFAVPGDVLILTKPLGTTIALALHRALKNSPEMHAKILHSFTPFEIEVAKGRAIRSMSQSNLKASVVIRQFAAHAVCDVGQHGLFGHADILVKQQVMPLGFVISNLPVISKMNTAAKVLGCSASFSRGTHPEISGGLLISIGRDQAQLLIKEFEKNDDHRAWIIGTVTYGNRDVRIADNPRYIDFPEKPILTPMKQRKHN